MERFEDHLRQVIQYSLQKPPEEMLQECLRILIEISGASGGSILAEEGPHLKFLFADVESLIGAAVPWDSIAGHCARDGKIIYTFAPRDKRHFDGIDAEIARRTEYLLSIPIPSIHRTSSAADAADDHSDAAGALQLLFHRDIFPEFDVAAGAQEFSLGTLKNQDAYAVSLQEVFWILPNISLGMEVMKLRQTSYQVIHELKNKMISAISWANCLQEDLEELAPELLADASITEDLQLTRRAVNEGAALAKGYLQFSKIYNPTFAATEINDVLRDTAASVRTFAADNGGSELEVITELDAGVPARQLDAGQLKMAFFNLGKNAAEALVEHGVPGPRISFSSAFVSDRIRVVVADNGNGMPAEIAENLFVAFKTKKKGGTGLGLTITKKIVDVHGGRICCETGADGTRFVVLL